MPTLFLRGEPIGTIKGVLFDKDGTISNSEVHLLNLAKLRVQEAARLLTNQGASLDEVNNLRKLLSTAYGLTNQGISPNGTIAIGSRENNIISTATVLSLLGENWPKALEFSIKIFQLVDEIDLGESQGAEQRFLIPGVRRLLQSLHKEKVTCALISNDSRPSIQSFLSKNNLQGLFFKFFRFWNQRFNILDSKA